MRTVLALVLLLIPVFLQGQNNSINGEILDEEANPMPSATAILLNPVDSTLLYFGVSNTNGKFGIKNIKPGTYLLQIAFIGYKTIYRNIMTPFEDNGDLGSFFMTPLPVALDEVTVTGERVPMRITNDTIEYDAKAFKVEPGGVVEDLIKKLPGMEVDRAGNIKALGEDVRNVLVDGKEFFGNDPKVATKNLPADAIDKVQLYNKKSEEAEFTGIDDGTRNQTLNLTLDEEKKDGIFGELMAGGGTGKHYQANGKIYRFSRKTQLAALGMINNVNKYGFSIGDYLSFTGGMSNLGSGRFILGGGDFPVNFGETVTGYASTGAAGLNMSYSPRNKQRFFVSYLGNGSKKELSEQIKTTNYREEDFFLQDENTEQTQRDTSHRVNFGMRYLFNETNNLIINGSVSYNTGYNPFNSITGSFLDNNPVNQQVRNSEDRSDRLYGNIDASYLKKINEGNTIIKIHGNGIFTNSRSETGFENTISYYSSDLTEVISRFQDDIIKSGELATGIAITQKIANGSYIDFVIDGAYESQYLNRIQSNKINGQAIVDSLSPDFIKNESLIKPGIAIRKNTEKINIRMAVEYNNVAYNTRLWQDNTEKSSYRILQPEFSFEYSYGTGRRFILDYSGNMSTPTVSQMLPVVNNYNSLSLFYGNRDLKPEYSHRINTQFWVFDQFSFTSFLASASLNYITDKINYSRTINDQLVQEIRLINVKSDLTAKANIDFSTPIRFLGLKTSINIDETYNKGTNFVNGIENDIKSLNHRLSLNLENRKKNKWDINSGLGLSFTDTRYSIMESLNNVYMDISWFGEIRWTPNDNFDLNLNADITNYTARSFEQSQLIPLIGAQLSYFFMDNNRASLSLSGFDLLNKNTGIKRISELNYLRETRSDIIGRYIMLSFKYRLNKTGGDQGIVVDVKKR